MLLLSVFYEKNFTAFFARKYGNRKLMKIFEF